MKKVKVRELVEQLSKLPQDKEILLGPFQYGENASDQIYYYPEEAIHDSFFDIVFLGQPIKENK